MMLVGVVLAVKMHNLRKVCVPCVLHSVQSFQSKYYNKDLITEFMFLVILVSAYDKYMSE